MCSLCEHYVIRDWLEYVYNIARTIYVGIAIIASRKKCVPRSNIKYIIYTDSVYKDIQTSLV